MTMPVALSKRMALLLEKREVEYREELRAGPNIRAVVSDPGRATERHGALQSSIVKGMANMVLVSRPLLNMERYMERSAGLIMSKATTLGGVRPA